MPLIRDASPNFDELLKLDPASELGYRAPLPGELFRNPFLANTFRRLATLGKKGFYEGPIAEAIVGVVQERGGDICLDDLIRHAEIGSEEVDPISLRFCAQDFGTAPALPTDSEGDGLVDIWECPPNGQGIVALMALGILQELERSGRLRKFNGGDHNCAE